MREKGSEAGKERGEMGWYATDPCPVPGNMPAQYHVTTPQWPCEL